MSGMTMASGDTVRGSRARWLRRAVCSCPWRSYNTIQTLDETAAKSQKEIEVRLKRRSELITNLVAAVKGFAARTKSTFEAVAKAQCGLTGALARPGGANQAELEAASHNLSRAVLPMMTLVTSYPKLCSDVQFLKLQDELTGTESRIAASRTDYNNSLSEYNACIRKIPAVMTAKVLGSKPREYFEVTDAAKRDVPTMDLHAALAAAAPASKLHTCVGEQMIFVQRLVTKLGVTRRMRVTPGAIFLLATLAGCLARKTEEEGPSPPVLAYTIPVTAESRFREDLTLFVIHDGLASRLTRITSVSTTRFVIPRHMIGAGGELSLMVERVGARSGTTDRYSSGRLRVLSGQGLVWTLETNLQQSFLQVVPAEVLLPDSIK